MIVRSVKIFFMCDLIGSILFGSEKYFDLYQNIIKTLFNRLEWFHLTNRELLTIKIILIGLTIHQWYLAACSGNPAE